MNYPTACWNCQHFDGMTGQGTAALCSRPGACRVRSGPHTGCSAFEAAPGAPGAPPAEWDPPGQHIDLVADLRRS